MAVWIVKPLGLRIAVGLRRRPAVDSEVREFGLIAAIVEGLRHAGVAAFMHGQLAVDAETALLDEVGVLVERSLDACAAVGVERRPVVAADRRGRDVRRAGVEKCEPDVVAVLVVFGRDFGITAASDGRLTVEAVVIRGDIVAPPIVFSSEICEPIRAIEPIAVGSDQKLANELIIWAVLGHYRIRSVAKSDFVAIAADIDSA